MGNSASKSKASGSQSVPPISDPIEPLPSPKTPPMTFTIPEDLRLQHRKKCEDVLDGLKSHRMTLSGIAAEVDRARKELEAVKGELGTIGEERKKEVKTNTSYEPLPILSVSSPKEDPPQPPRVSLTKLQAKMPRNNIPSELIPDELISSESAALLRSNVLRRMSVFSSFSKGEIYDLDSMKLIMSTLIKEKEAEDRRAIEQHIRPRSFPDFLIELLLRSGKQQEEGLKHVAMLINSIQEHGSRGNLTANLFSKLFHLHQGEPVWYQFSVAVPRLYLLFHPLAEALYVEKKRKTGDFHLEFEDKARLADVLSMIYREFAVDPYSGGHLLMLLKPATVTAEDYMQFVFMHKVFATGRSFEEMIEAVTGDEKAQVAVDMLARALKRQLDLWLSEYDLKSLLHRYDQDQDGSLSKEDLQPLGPKAFSSLQTLDSYLLTAGEYLIALEEVARERCSRMVREFIRSFGKKDRSLGKEEVGEKVRKVARRGGDTEGDDVWYEVKRGKETVRISEVVSALVRFPVGEWENSPLVVPGLLQFQEPVSVEQLLVEAGNILEEVNEDE